MSGVSSGWWKRKRRALFTVHESLYNAVAAPHFPRAREAVKDTREHRSRRLECRAMTEYVAASNRPRLALLIVAVVLAVLSLADALLVDHPVAAVVYSLLVASGAVWLYRSSGRGPVLYLGVLLLLEFLAVVFIYPDPGEGLDARTVLFAAVTATGVIAAVLCLLAKRPG